MREYARVRQITGEPRRRWFGSADFDLILRVSDTGDFLSFELCYDKRSDERALCWRPSAGFSHMAVDSGEKRAGWGYKQTPILTPDVPSHIGRLDIARLHADFLAASRNLPRDVTDFVLRTLEQHPDFVSLN